MGKVGLTHVGPAPIRYELIPMCNLWVPVAFWVGRKSHLEAFQPNLALNESKFAFGPFSLSSALNISSGTHVIPSLLSVSSNWDDNVASALLNKLAFVEGGQSVEPLPAAEPGLSAWPHARGGFKRVGACGSSHSHGRTTQEHPSKVSPCPSTSRAQPGQAAAEGQGRAAGAPHPDNHTPHTTFPTQA